MSDSGKGWFLFLAAFGMMLTLEAVEISKLQAWSDATTPAFVGIAAAHIGTVIAAFIGGKLIPTSGD